jgi:hypothetical protein
MAEQVLPRSEGSREREDRQGIRERDGPNNVYTYE